MTEERIRELAESAYGDYMRDEGNPFKDFVRIVERTIAAAVREAVTVEREGFRDRLLEWRGVETACASCGGSGQRAYGSTSTWRGRGGGQSITQDVCDRCWGTGDERRHGADLRELHSRVDKAVAVEREACAEIASVHRQLDDSRHQVAVAIEGEIHARGDADGGDLEAE